MLPIWIPHNRVKQRVQRQWNGAVKKNWNLPGKRKGAFVGWRGKSIEINGTWRSTREEGSGSRGGSLEGFSCRIRRRRRRHLLCSAPTLLPTLLWSEKEEPTLLWAGSNQMGLCSNQKGNFFFHLHTFLLHS